MINQSAKRVILTPTGLTLLRTSRSTIILIISRPQRVTLLFGSTLIIPLLGLGKPPTDTAKVRNSIINQILLQSSSHQLSFSNRIRKLRNGSKAGTTLLHVLSGQSSRTVIERRTRRDDLVTRLAVTGLPLTATVLRDRESD